MAALTAGQASRDFRVFLAAYAIPSPVIHIVHGRSMTAVGALLLRAAVPVAAGAIGYEVDYATSSPCRGIELCWRGVEGALLGGVVGYVGALVIDAGVLAREETPRAGHVRLQPMVNVTKAGASGGIGGVF
jgi:hypothetical protein